MQSASRDKYVSLVSTQVLQYVLLRHGLVSDARAVSIPADLECYKDMIENLQKTLWIHTYFNSYEWRSYLEKFESHMYEKCDFFMTYTIFACYKIKEEVDDAYECFLRALALIADFCTYRCDDKSEYVFASVDMFTEFYHATLAKEFKDRGGWKKFNKFLVRSNALRVFKQVESSSKIGKVLDPDMLHLLQIECEPITQRIEKIVKNTDRAEIERHKPTKVVVDVLQDVLRDVFGNVAQQMDEYNTTCDLIEEQLQKLNVKSSFKSKGAISSSEDDFKEPSEQPESKGATAGAKMKPACMAEEIARNKKIVAVLQSKILVKGIIKDLTALGDTLTKLYEDLL